MSAVTVKTYPAPPFCDREILRYAGCKMQDAESEKLLAWCKKECENAFSYKVCFGEFPLTVYENTCDFGEFSVQSSALCRNMKGAERAVVFVASVGLAIDRLIAKYGKLSPSKAVFLQALGAERVEALCKAFCEELGTRAKPRFSPGFGDCTLLEQKKIFAVLDCAKRLGVGLNESGLASPSKTVTAFVGLKKEE